MRIAMKFARATWSKAVGTAIGLSVFFVWCAGAQDFRAKLTVTVTDPAGLSIPNAALQLTNVGTTEVFAAKTNENGVYSFLFLQPATYKLQVSAGGFRSATHENIALQSYQASGLEVKLEVGTATDSVTVTAEGALLQTETASRGVTVNSRLVTDLPVSNHNAMMLGQTLPGVYMRPLGGYTDPWTITSQYMINGGLMYLNEFQVDGAPNNAQFGSNTYGYTPPNEAVQEVSVQGNSYDSQYGHTSGGVINVSTKSGGRQFHADGWTYLKRTGWDADSFQNNAIGAPRPPAPQTQWGLQVAGPAYVPHVIPKSSERFQMFYLFSWDKYAELLPNALNLSYPEPEMRNGDFSKLTNGAGQLITIYDPSTGHLDASGNFIRTPFAGNIIPGNRINPIARNVANLLPLPNITTPGVRYSTSDVLEPGNVHHWNFYNWVSRLDFNIGSKYRLFVRPARMIFDELSNYNDITGPGKTGGVFSRANYALLVDFVATISPTLVANLRVNASQYGEGWHTPDNYGYDLTKLGLPQSFVSQLENPALFGQWNFSGYTSLGQSVNWNNTDTYSVQGSITKFIGGHNLRAGGDVRQTRYITYAPGYAFTFGSTADQTRSGWNDSSTESTSGDSFASFLLGTPSSGNALSNPAVFYKSWYVAPWVQDDWKVTKRLTVNLGLRYDLDVPRTRGTTA
jgi:Carboxypeptidase regulatory-like domain